MGDSSDTQGKKMDTGTMTSPPAAASAGLGKLASLPVYHTYLLYRPYLDFCQKMLLLEELLQKIRDMESLYANDYYVYTPDGPHFSGCWWAKPPSDAADVGGFDVVDMCHCSYIRFYTNRCINLLNSIGFNKNSTV